MAFGPLDTPEVLSQKESHQMMVVDCTAPQVTCFKTNINYKVMREETTNSMAKFLANSLYGISVPGHPVHDA